jgi:hypothetical protein
VSTPEYPVAPVPCVDPASNGSVEGTVKGGVRAEDTDAHLFRSRPAFDFLHTCPSMMAPINSRVVRGDVLAASPFRPMYSAVRVCARARARLCGCMRAFLRTRVHAHMYVHACGE